MSGSPACRSAKASGGASPKPMRPLLHAREPERLERVRLPGANDWPSDRLQAGWLPDMNDRSRYRHLPATSRQLERQQTGVQTGKT